MPGSPSPINVQQSTPDWWNPFTWFSGAGKAAGNWFGGLGGDIASGLEGGFAAILIDMVKWAIPYLEIFAGFIILWLVFMYAIKDDLMAAISTVASVAGTAAKASA